MQTILLQTTLLCFSLKKQNKQTPKCPVYPKVQKKRQLPTVKRKIAFLLAPSSRLPDLPGTEAGDFPRGGSETKKAVVLY